MFHRKPKPLQTAPNKGPPFNVVQTLTSVGIDQIKQMIAFLLESHSKCQIHFTHRFHVVFLKKKK